MKLLGWMHCKFPGNGGHQFKDFAAAGKPCNYLSGGPSPHRQQHNYSVQALKLPDRQILADHQDQPINDDGLFLGLLTIGTLGSPGTRTTTTTFGLPPAALERMEPTLDSIDEVEEHNEATGLELKVISMELEKVHDVVPEGNRLSSARTSHVGATQLVVSNSPLQEYLLGASMEKTEEQRKKENGRHHQRTSLAELFMKSNLTEEGGGGRGCGGGGRNKSAVGVPQLIVKKMLTAKKMLKRRSAISGGGDDLASGSKSKFEKIMQMFRKKVHPENSTAAKKGRKPSGRSKNEGGGGGGGASVLASAAKGKSARKESDPGHSCPAISPGSGSVDATGSCESTGNRWQWIKTDADYLVLEL